MPGPRRDRKRKPGRRAPFRLPKPIILIVCEGEKTEPQYLEGFTRACHNSRVEIHIAREHGVPKTLVEIAKKRKHVAEKAAKREKDENLKYDAVWCVFDCDDHPHIPDAQQMARDNAIELAISNPCFELWLFLHFRESPGMQHRDALRKLLKKFVPNYEKQVKYETYSDGYLQAVTRAKQLHEAACSVNESGRNPTTNVWELTELIRQE